MECAAWLRPRVSCSATPASLDPHGGARGLEEPGAQRRSRHDAQGVLAETPPARASKAELQAHEFEQNALVDNDVIKAAD